MPPEVTISSCRILLTNWKPIFIVNMMNYKEQTTELNLIPIRDIASWVGQNLPERGSALCPFPDHPEKNKSFEVKKGGVRWQCYSCNRSGGSIDFVSAYFGYDFITAKKWLLSKTGTSSRPTPLRRAVKVVAEKPIEPLRDCRRQFGLSYAAIAGSSSIA